MARTPKTDEQKIIELFGPRVELEDAKARLRLAQALVKDREPRQKRPPAVQDSH
jgi:hypothetical protein